MMFFETSAKTADHVNECFMDLTSRIVVELQKRQVKRKDNVGSNNVDLGNKSKTTARNQGCC